MWNCHDKRIRSARKCVVEVRANHDRRRGKRDISPSSIFRSHIAIRTGPLPRYFTVPATVAYPALFEFTRITRLEGYLSTNGMNKNEINK